MESGGHQRACQQTAYDSGFLAASGTFDPPLPPTLSLFLSPVIQGPGFFTGIECV